MSWLGHGFSIPFYGDAQRHALGKYGFIRTRAANAPESRLERRGTGSERPSSSNSHRWKSPIKSPKQPSASSSRPASNLQESFQKSGSPANTLSFQAPKTVKETSRQNDQSLRIESVEPDRQKSKQAQNQAAVEAQTRRGSIRSVPSRMNDIQKTIAKAGGPIDTPTQPTQKRITNQGIGASRPELDLVDHKSRIAHNSGTTSAMSAIGPKNIQDKTDRASILSLQDRARMIEHHEWLTEAKDSIGKAEQAWKRMSKADRRIARSYSAVTDAATAKATQSKANSKQARVIAKEAISKTDELLHSEPASSAKAGKCLSSTNDKMRTACAAGAVHATMEHKAAIVANGARRFDLVVTHSKAKAKAMTRARAFEEQNHSYQAHYRAKAAKEKVQALLKDDPGHEKARKTAELEQKDYETSAQFYRSVHDQYRQTRKAFPGTDSEDEERVPPGSSYPTSKP